MQYADKEELYEQLRACDIIIYHIVDDAAMIDEAVWVVSRKCLMCYDSSAIIDLIWFDLLMICERHRGSLFCLSSADVQILCSVHQPRKAQTRIHVFMLQYLFRRINCC